MSDDPMQSHDDAPGRTDLSAAKWVLPGLLVLVAVGFLAYSLLSSPPPAISEEVAHDALLLEGREVYLGRCATCHGMQGRGDGPIAGYLMGPPVGNLSDGQWKHGDKAEEVMAVISRGVKDTRMAGWGTILEEHQLRAVSAYVFYLANQPVPPALRGSGQAQSGEGAAPSRTSP